MIFHQGHTIDNLKLRFMLSHSHLPWDKEMKEKSPLKLLQIFGINHSQPLEQNFLGETILHNAVRSRKINNVKFAVAVIGMDNISDFLEKKSFAIAWDLRSRTATEFALKNNDKEIVDYLNSIDRKIHQPLSKIKTDTPEMH